MQACYRFSKLLQDSSRCLILFKRYYARKTLYDVLEIPPDASQSQIKAAYFRLSKKYHPDVNKASDAQLSFGKLSEAYTTLSNAGSKIEYDSKTFGGRNYNANTYQDFHFTPTSKIKKTRPGYQTGKSAYYDYGEFYRKHYEEMIHESRQHKMSRENYEEQIRKSRYARTYASTGYMVMLISTYAFLLIYGK